MTLRPFKNKNMVIISHEMQIRYQSETFHYESQKPFIVKLYLILSVKHYNDHRKYNLTIENNS